MKSWAIGAISFAGSVTGCPVRPRRLIVTMLVFYNRLLGRAYVALIAPFHRMVVRTSPDRAHKRGWPGDSGHPAAAPSRQV